MKTFKPGTGPAFPIDPLDLCGLKPRGYAEWKALKRWGKLPRWEFNPAGYLLREAREMAGLTQKDLAARLGVSQQAIAQAERWDSNPTINFVRAWIQATGGTLTLNLGI